MHRTLRVPRRAHDHVHHRHGHARRRLRRVIRYRHAGRRGARRHHPGHLPGRRRPGTLREALEAGAEHIVIDPSVDVIEIASTLTGHTSVRIEGGGAVIDADAVGVALAVTADPGTSGVLAVDISHLTVLGAGDHGSYITDDQDGDLDAAGSGPPVPVSLTVRSVVVEDVGHAAFDRDGIR